MERGWKRKKIIQCDLYTAECLCIYMCVCECSGVYLCAFIIYIYIYIYMHIIHSHLGHFQQNPQEHDKTPYKVSQNHQFSHKKRWGGGGEEGEEEGEEDQA